MLFLFIKYRSKLVNLLLNSCYIIKFHTHSVLALLKLSVPVWVVLNECENAVLSGYTGCLKKRYENSTGCRASEI
jgi:hypothetical protein